MVRSNLFKSLLVAVLLIFTATTNDALADQRGEYSTINEVIDVISALNINLSYLYGGNYLLGAFVFWEKRLWFHGLGMLLLLPVSFFYGALVVPTITVLIVNTSMASGSMVLGTVLYAFWNLLALAVFAFMGFLPSIIASKRKVEKFKLIFGCNFIGFLPLAWPILLHFSLNEKKGSVS